MGKDEIREIAAIVGKDNTYRHFVKRINKEFEDADEVRNSHVYVIFIKRGFRKVGFSVIGRSPAKMKVWFKTFKQEGWVPENFEMSESALELMYMYLKPEFRNKGYGTKLFRKTLGFVKGKSIKEIYAYVGGRSPQALEFYKRMNADVISDFSDEETASAFLRWKI